MHNIDWSQMCSFQIYGKWSVQASKHRYACVHDAVMLVWSSLRLSLVIYEELLPGSFPVYFHTLTVNSRTRSVQSLLHTWCLILCHTPFDVGSCSWNHYCTQLCNYVVLCLHWYCSFVCRFVTTQHTPCERCFLPLNIRGLIPRLLHFFHRECGSTSPGHCL